MVRVLLDTNVLLRDLFSTDPQHLQVKASIDRILRKGWTPCIGTQNMVEFWVVATRPLSVNGFGLTPAQAEQKLRLACNFYTVLNDPPVLRDTWLDLCVRYGVSGRQAHDARLVALMFTHGIDHILTLNGADFTRYSEITVLAP